MLAIRIVKTHTAKGVGYRVTGFKKANFNAHVCKALGGKPTAKWLVLDDVGTELGSATTRREAQEIAADLTAEALIHKLHRKEQ